MDSGLQRYDVFLDLKIRRLPKSWCPFLKILITIKIFRVHFFELVQLHGSKEKEVKLFDFNHLTSLVPRAELKPIRPIAFNCRVLHCFSIS